MRFKFHGLDEPGFDNWIDKLRSSKEGVLNRQAYLELHAQTIGHPVVYYSGFDQDLFHDILNHCVEAGTRCDDEHMSPKAHGSEPAEPKQSSAQH